MEKRKYGEFTTLETRHESHESVDKQKRYEQILEILNGNEMTAKEVAVAMFWKGYTDNMDRNNSAPRLTELCLKGEVEPIGKKKCSYTGKTVAVYRVRDGRS